MIKTVEVPGLMLVGMVGLQASYEGETVMLTEDKGKLFSDRHTACFIEYWASEWSWL